MLNYKKINEQTEEFENSNLYLYGSGKMDQLCLLKKNPQSDESLPESKNIIKINCKFLNPKEKIKTIACGSYNTMILSTNGNVYTFGCSDNFGLGHIKSTTNLKVKLTFKALGISCGECHGIAYNKKNLAFWGQFKNSNGALGIPFHVPHYFNNSNIENNYFKKVISGKNHVLILTDEKNIFAFGNYEYGQTGLYPKNKHDFLLLNKIKEHNVEDIFTGDQHSFLIKYENNIKILKSWGLNNFGQLGIGGSFYNVNNENIIYVPTKVEFPFFENISVEKVSGGSENSICLSNTNRVFVWGNNQNNLLGLNDDENKIISRPKEILFFNKNIYPNNKVDEIYASANFFYAKNNFNNKVYSWGCGNNFVLGNKTENSEKKPFEINPFFFKNIIVSQIALGYSHVAILLKNDKNKKMESEFEFSSIIKSQPIYNTINVFERRRNKLEDESEEEDYDNKSNKGVESVVKEEYITLNIEDLPKPMNISKFLIDSNSKSKSKKKFIKGFSDKKSKKDFSEKKPRKKSVKISEKKSENKKNKINTKKEINETIFKKEHYIHPKKNSESKSKQKSIKNIQKKYNVNNIRSTSSKKQKYKEEIINTEVKEVSPKKYPIIQSINNNRRKTRSTINLEEEEEEEKKQQTSKPKKKIMKKEDFIEKEKILRLRCKKYFPVIKKSQRSNIFIKRCRSCDKNEIKEKKYKNFKKDERSVQKIERKGKIKNSIQKSKIRRTRRKK